MGKFNNKATWNPGTLKFNFAVNKPAFYQYNRRQDLASMEGSDCEGQFGLLTYAKARAEPTLPKAAKTKDHTFFSQPLPFPLLRGMLVSCLLSRLAIAVKDGTLYSHEQHFH